MEFEGQQYEIVRRHLERLGHKMDSREQQIVDTQSRLGPELEELRSKHGIEFQRSLARFVALSPMGREH